VGELNRILLKTGEVDASGRVQLSGPRARHVIDVLHGRVGQNIRVGVIDGPVGEGIIEEMNKSAVVMTCRLGSEIPDPPGVGLLLALPRPKVMKRLWAPLASLGLGHIVLTNAAKVERNYFDTKWLSEEHYRPLLIDGLMQSGDTRLPHVTVCRRFKVFVEDELDQVFAGYSRFVCHPGGRSAVDSLSSGKPGRLLLAVGPEGGWTEFELDLLKAHGFDSISLGRRVLRSDTACIAVLGLVHAVLRD